MNASVKRMGSVATVIAVLGGWVQAETGLGRHKKLYAVPVPAGGQVVIDGRLDDWDLSGQIDPINQSSFNAVDGKPVPRPW